MRKETPSTNRNAPPQSEAMRHLDAIREQHEMSMRQHSRDVAEHRPHRRNEEPKGNRAIHPQRQMG